MSRVKNLLYDKIANQWIEQKGDSEGYSLVKVVSEESEVTNVPLNNNSKILIYKEYNGYTPVCMLYDRILARKNNRYFILVGWDDPNPDEITMPASGIFHWYLFARPDKDTYRLMICIGNKIYHNYADGGGVNDWAESNVWGLPDVPNPVDITTKEYNNRIRPKFYIPDGCNYVFEFMGGMQYKTKWFPDYTNTEVCYFATYSSRSTPTCVFETIDGVDVYVQYQYGIRDGINYGLGKDIDFSDVTGDMPSDLKVQRRTNIIPNASTPEPTDVFAFEEAVSVSAIIVDGTKTKVTANAHGLSSGNIVRFTSQAVTENTDNWITPELYADILNNSAVTAWAGEKLPPGGNGKFYWVEKIDDNNFYLKEAIGNPHNHLVCKHIHSIDVVKGGLVVSTGESGDDSNITYLHTSSQLDVNKRMVQGDFAQIHLTANPVKDITGSIQRTLGFYMEDDWFIFASDETVYYRTVDLPTGRTDKIKYNCSGVYRGEMKNIDNWSSLTCVLDNVAVAWLFKKIGDVFVFCDTVGYTYYSMDKGLTWNLFYKFDIPIEQFRGFSQDRTEFIIDNYLFKVNV